MRGKLILFVFCVLSSSPCLAHQSIADASFDAYYDGNKYEYVVTRSMVDKAPHWSPDVSANPPVSTAAALAKSAACINEVSTKPGMAWELRELALGKAAGGWIWIVRYRLILKGQPMTGYWPTLFCPILMDGTVVKPIITKHEM